MIHFYENFEYGNIFDSLVIGVQDYSKYLKPMSPRWKPDLADHGDGGHCLHFQDNFFHPMNWQGGTSQAKLPDQADQDTLVWRWRMKFTGRKEVPPPPGAEPWRWWGPLFMISQQGMTNPVGVCINGFNTLQRISRSGLIGASISTDYDEPLVESILSTEKPITTPGSWHWYKVVYNTKTGRFRLFVDTILQFDTNIGIHKVNGFHFHRCRHSLDYMLDDLSIGDAEFEPEGVLAVGVSTVQESWDAFSQTGNCIASLIMGGEHYHFDWDYIEQTLTSSNAAGGFPNMAYVWHQIFKTSPQGGPWSNEQFAAIEAWGVCACFVWAHAEGAEQRLKGLGLDWAFNKGDDQIVIRMKAPTTATIISGSWRKDMPDKPLAAHLNQYPRAYVSDPAPSLYTSVPGCILFTPPAGPETELDDPQDKGLTFAQEYREDYTDWVKVGDPQNFVSYFISGYSVLGEANKEFQSNYVTVNYENPKVADGGAYMQAVWDYTTSPSTGRWSTPQQVYRTKINYTHQMNKMKARGHGKALQFKVFSEDKKDFIINGWSTLVTGNAMP